MQFDDLPELDQEDGSPTLKWAKFNSKKLPFKFIEHINKKSIQGQENN